jgi:hypothetical protein
MISRATIAIVALAVLAACTNPRQQAIERQARAASEFLERQGSIGDPGRVAAADFAFAKMAREEGQWTAFRAYAADDAVMDAPGGYAPVSEVLAGLADPAEPIRWAPTNVWSSCDGTLAVSLGRFIRPNGLVGDYVTVWELQRDNTYKWVYDTGTPDDPQPVSEPDEELPEDAIVVEGMTSIEGRIADCPQRGEQFSPPAGTIVRAGSVSDTRFADDRTLRVDREYFLADSRREVRILWQREGAWQQAFAMTIPGEE